MRHRVDPGSLAIWLVGLLLVLFAVTVDFPKVAFGFLSDEATYYTLGQSLARDGDFAFDRQDLARVWEEFPSGPEGIFLKRARLPRTHLTGSFPFLSLDSIPDPRNDRLYFGKAFVYPLAAAPFVWLMGTNGFLLLNCLLLTLDLLAAYWFLRAQSGIAPSLAYALVFFVASAAPVYVVWITPEMFNLSVGLLGLFLWAYKEVSPDPPRSTPWSRWLRSGGSTYAGAALIGIATFSKPTHIALILPVLGLALLRRRWRAAVGAALVCAVLAGGLFLVNYAITGEANYQGGDRNTFYGVTGFPFQTPTFTFRSAGMARARDALMLDAIFSRDALVEVFPRNLVYFFFGRNTGLFPYFFPGVLSALLLLIRWRRTSPVQRLSFLTFCAATIGMLLLVPYTYSGGGAPIGNRYFMGLYPLLLFATPVIGSLGPAFLAVLVGGAFSAQLVLNPFWASFHPADHQQHGAFLYLPVEKTLANDLPVNVSHSRVRQSLGGTPPVMAYFLDDNAYGLEGDWFWVRGRSHTELLLRSPAVTAPDGIVTTKRIVRLSVELRNGDVPNVVTVDTGAHEQEVPLQPHEWRNLIMGVERGVPYRLDPRQPPSYIYWLAITSATGFTPMFTAPPARDSRFLGVYVHIVPTYQ